MKLIMSTLFGQLVCETSGELSLLAINRPLAQPIETHVGQLKKATE